jgi:transcription elongation factor Elf1
MGTSERFERGKLRTVGLELARTRIEALTGEKIDIEAIKAFQTIARHRNRVVHFFHAELDSNSQRENVIGEFYVAWHYLYQLLSGPWKKYFSPYSYLILEFGARMQSLSPYLDAIFDRIVKNNQDVKTYTKCPVCSHESLDSATDNRYQAAICHVCGYIEPLHKAIQHGEENFIANCAFCDGFQTVRATEFGLLKCSECGEKFLDYTTCSHCGEHWVGNTDPDYGDLSGCNYCDGVISRIKDD